MNASRKRRASTENTEPVVYSMLPFIGAVMWHKLRASQPTQRLCAAIHSKTGDVYDSIVAISKMPGGEEAAFALDPTPDPSDYYIAWLPAGPARERSILFHRVCRTCRITYGPDAPRSLIERDARRCAPLAIDLQTKHCEKNGDLVGLVFWKYVAAMTHACPTGVRALPVGDSLMCYQVAKCAYETDAYPELTCDDVSRVDGAMISGHRRLVEYYKVRTLKQSSPRSGCDGDTFG